MNNGISYKTNLLGEDLSSVKRIVFGHFNREDSFAHFRMKDKIDIDFTIILENVSCIEYELLSEEGIIEFEDFINIKEDTLKKILSEFKNNYRLGIALIHTDKELIDKIVNCLSDERKEILKDIIKMELGKIKMTDVQLAQKEIIELVNELNNSEKIKLEIKK